MSISAANPIEHGARVERLTRAIVATIEEADPTYAVAQHALTRALGAIIGANSEDEADCAATVAIATRAIAGCARDAELMAKHGRRLRPARSYAHEPADW